MLLCTYLETHKSEPAAFALLIGVHLSSVYRWIQWSKGEGGNRPDPDQIVAIQRATGGLVTILDWTKDRRPEAAVDPQEQEDESATRGVA